MSRAPASLSSAAVFAIHAMSTHESPVVPLRQFAPIILLGAVKGFVAACILAGFAGLNFAFFMPAGAIAGAAIGFSMGIILSAASEDSSL